MPSHPPDHPFLTRLIKISSGLPETTIERCGSHAAFRIRKKTYAYFLNNHHGDGIIAVTGKVLPGDNKALAAAQPSKFYLPAYIASKGWVALRLDLPKIDWSEVRELVLTSYILTAPKRLAVLVRGPTESEKTHLHLP
jgi:predicted DNA-binding protein (MmcQ/YjbR family)